MMKTTKLVLLTGSLLLLCSLYMSAQVKIGVNPLTISDNRLLEIESGSQYFFVKDASGMMIGRANAANDALMLKLYGYGLNDATFRPTGALGSNTARSAFLGSNGKGEIIEFPLKLELDTIGADIGLLSLNDGHFDFGSVQLDSVFATNSQLVDSINNVRVLVQQTQDDDKDKDPTNEHLIEVSFGEWTDQAGVKHYNVLTIRDAGDTYRRLLDLGLASDKQLDDSIATLRGFNFYLADNTFDDATRTASGAGVTNLTFDQLSQFNVTNTPIINLNATTGNAAVTSTSANVVVGAASGTVDVDGGIVDIDGSNTVDVTAANNATLSSTGANVVVGAAVAVDVDGATVTVDGSNTVDVTAANDATLSSTNADVNINSATTGGEVDINAPLTVVSDTMRLENYGAGTYSGSESFLLGVGADGTVLEINVANIGGDATLSSPVDLDENDVPETTVDQAIQAANREIDSTIYNYDGTLTGERTMSMDGNNLFFVSQSGNDTTVIDAEGRIAIGRGAVTDNSANTGMIKLDVNGDIYARRVHSSSDRRFKKNIAVLDNALSKVMQIEGVTWNWRQDEFPNRDFTNEEEVGFIAQNIEKVLPQVVMTAADGYKAVDYAKVTALLTEAIKEQQKLIEKQQAIIVSQNDKIDTQHDKMNEMGSILSELQNQIESIVNQQQYVGDE